MKIGKPKTTAILKTRFKLSSLDFILESSTIEYAGLFVGERVRIAVRDSVKDYVVRHLKDVLK